MNDRHKLTTKYLFLFKKIGLRVIMKFFEVLKV